MKSLHLILCILMFLCCLLVVFSANPVESVLYLILTFCNAGAILFFFNLEFFGLIFVIIYVGAIAVLFLFVIMMLNIKVRSSFLGSLNSKNNILYIVATFVIFNLLSAIYLNLIAAVPFVQVTPSDINSTSSAYLLFDDLSNVDVLGQVFYNYYFLYLPLAGFILLIALVGVIVLTLHFNKPKKTQLDSRQLSRSDNFISFFNNRSN